MNNEKLIETLTVILIIATIAAGCGLIAFVLWILPKPIFNLLLLSSVLGCVVGIVDILSEDLT